MKTIFKIHPLFLLFAFSSVITGIFRNFIVFMLIIIIHEFGHVLAAFFLKIYPKEIIILPFGGLTIFNMKLNTSINKEFLIAISGVCMQLIGWIILKDKLGSEFDIYNLSILLFNLLPIYPLDGSKIFNLILCKFISYKMSFFITMYISFVSIILFVFFILCNHFSLSWLIILLFLSVKTIDELYNFKYLFNKFLWERINYSFYFKKKKLIEKIDYVKRDYKHLFKIGNTLVSEDEILKKRFDFQNKV